MQYVVDVKRYAFTDSLRRFDETVIAAADRGRAALLSCTRDTLSVLDTQALSAVRPAVN